jgi:hypothetical protein
MQRRMLRRQRIRMTRSFRLEGRERAQRLVKAIGRYKPGAFYSTNFKRTRDTVSPWAAKRGKTVEIYDPRKPQELLDKIMASKTKRFVIAGHSNSTPGVVNLLVKKDLFKNLDESVYDRYLGRKDPGRKSEERRSAGLLIPEK